jgi:tRNA(fMet)-specific endonuclease VapC
MNGKYLLDTSIIIALFLDDQTVKRALNKAAEVFVPVIAIGELYYGALRSGRVVENLQKIDQMITSVAILDCDHETARICGFIKNKLRERGRPIPENDIWIAAIAAQKGLTLATRDTHFAEIPDLNFVFW